MGHAKYDEPQASPKNKGFHKEKKGVGRDCFEQKSVGEEQELWVVVASRWLSCGGFSWLGCC